jgi:glycosyltransferase involved in cell wall biosynthesis
MAALDVFPIISVVIPTYNRADLLAAALQSLRGQDISREEFEVVVVDDGSTDQTAEVCRTFGAEMQVRYVQLSHVGTSAAKNLGIFLSRGVLTFLFDDDDVATPDLLRMHIQSHQQHPEEEVAILGYTTWAPGLEKSEVMHFVTDVGHYLFSYGNLRDGQILDYTHFWTGRISCKRTFLVRRGVFNPDIQPAYEDIELGYRLARHGLKILFNRAAVSYMNRPITYDDFCRRCELQGRSQFIVRQYHTEPVVDEHVRVTDAQEEWIRIRPELGEKVERVRALEDQLREAESAAAADTIRAELYSLYRETFRSFRVKGYVERAETVTV